MYQGFDYHIYQESLKVGNCVASKQVEQIGLHNFFQEKLVE